MKQATKKLILGGPAGSGWDQFKFILTPDELNQILEPYDFFIFKSGVVEKDHEYSEFSELITDYHNYWKKITSGTNWIPSLDNKIFPRFIFTDNQSDIEINDYTDPKYKVLKETRPVIFIEPFQIYYNDFKLNTNDYNPEGNIGLNLIYPKIFCYLEEGKLTGFEKTDTFNTKQLFLMIKESILKKTKKLVFQADQKLFKPAIYISDNAKLEISDNYYLNLTGLKIK